MWVGDWVAGWGGEGHEGTVSQWYVGRYVGLAGGLGRRMEQRMMRMCRRPRKGMIRGDESGQ
jgi:hypothetical protein